jgi:hypothetical protein
LKHLLAEWQERRLPQREAAALLLELLLTTDGSHEQ